MLNPKLIRCLLGISLSIFTFSALSQSLPSSQLYHELLKLKETRRVLYIAAHPDDENTKLIAYLANEELAQVAYMSLTRGDGGQNLIGPELGIGLGQIRTQELLKARETDGGRQFFSRAKDFGYSKNPTETLQNWDKETILSDVVWVIRKFRPEIIITRFNTTPGVTHGHHTTSAILAGEAMGLAGDPNAFSEQLQFVETWKPKRIFWNTYNFRGDFVPEEGKQYFAFPTGDYNPLLGETYSQLASDSRTMHKSQGFGSTPSMGESLDHIQFIAGDPMVDSPFDGVTDKWEGITGGSEIEAGIQNAIDEFDFVNPSNNVPALLKLKSELNKLKTEEVWVIEKKKALDRLIVQALGIDFEFNVRQEEGFPGSTVPSELLFNNPSNEEVSNLSVEVFDKVYPSDLGSIQSNELVNISIPLELDRNEPYSQPYWLENYVDGPMYPIDDQQKIGKPFNDIQVGGNVNFEIAGEKFSFPVQLFYKYNDPVDGEVKQPFVVIPEIDLRLSKNTVFLLNGTNPQVSVRVHFNGEMKDGELTFEGLESDQYKILEVMDFPSQKDRVYSVEFQKNGNGKKVITAQYTIMDGSVFNQVTERISYKHIPNLTYFQPASIALIQADWKVSGNEIGYVPGAGDDVPQVLEALGYKVVMIGENDYNLDQLSRFQTIIIGIRAYNVNEALVSNQQAMMGYVRSGGHLIVQYNTTGGLMLDKFGPYPFDLTRNRVAVEEAEVKADFSHPILAGPNKINQDDFKNWVQERGLYFAGNLAPEYSTPFVMNDPGEDPQNGSLIYAKYGEGTFVYTGLSFFRELPAGVPGAIKLFINLIEQ